MVLLEFAMTPSVQEESKSRYVARIIDVIDKSGVPYQLTPMGTILEGEWAAAQRAWPALKDQAPRRRKLELEEVEKHVADDVDVHAPGIARPGGLRCPS